MKPSTKHKRDRIVDADSRRGLVEYILGYMTADTVTSRAEVAAALDAVIIENKDLYERKQ